MFTTLVGMDTGWDVRIAGWLNAVRARVRTGVSAPSEIRDVRATIEAAMPGDDVERVVTEEGGVLDNLWFDAKQDPNHAYVLVKDGDLLADRNARVDDLSLLVDLITSGWKGVDARIARMESLLGRLEQSLQESHGAVVYRMEDRRPDAATS